MLAEKKQNVGLKIYSNKKLLSQAKEIALALPEAHPLEIGFYDSDGNMGYDVWVKDILNYFFFQHKRRVAHLSMQNSVFSYSKKRKVWHSELMSEVDAALDIQAEYVIIHDALSPAPNISNATNRARQEEFIDLMVKNAEYLHKFIPIDLYMENTYQPVSFYRAFFDKAQQNIQFCFDVGHANLWGASPLSEWRDFLHELKRRGNKIHFHFHSNDGLYDRHASFVQLPQPSLQNFILELIDEFSEANAIFEIANDFAETLETFA